MQQRALNEKINITGWYFQNRKGINTFPKRMEYKGESYTFSEACLQVLVKKGESVTRMFDVTDGHSQFRLKCDEALNSWTLVGITSHI